MKLAAYLSENNLSDAEFADILGCDRTTVTRLRNETTRPTWKQVDRIAAATGGAVTANDFIREIAPTPEGAAA